MAVAEGLVRQAIRVTFCDACEHTYLSRRPTATWFQNYYAADWDTGKQPKFSQSRLSSIKGAIRRSNRARRVIRAGRVLRWDLSRSVYPWPPRFLHMIAGLDDAEGNQFPRGKKALEIGTGYGGALDFMREIGFDAYGTEANEHRVAVCQAWGLNVRLTPIDDFAPVAPDGPFDFVSSSHVFEHMTDLGDIMAKLEPLVANEGFVYLEVPHGAVMEDIIIRTHIPVHCHVFSVKSLCTLLKRFGFQPIRILADTSIHVVAQKSDKDTVVGGAEIPVTATSLARWLDVLDKEDGPLLFKHDQYRHDIYKQHDDVRVFSAHMPYATMSTGQTLVKKFLIQRELDDESRPLPIRFTYPSDQAPLWVKTQ